MPPGVRVGVGVAEDGQPARALFTAAISSLISRLPLPSRSVTGQPLSGAFPSAILTAVISSLIETTPSPLQSPAQGCARPAAGAKSTARRRAETHIDEIRERTGAPFIFSSFAGR